MSKSLQEIAEAAGTESVAYAVQEGYIKPEDFADPELAECVREARFSLDKLDAALGPYLP